MDSVNSTLQKRIVMVLTVSVMVDGAFLPSKGSTSALKPYSLNESFTSYHSTLLVLSWGQGTVSFVSTCRKGGLKLGKIK